MKSKYRIIERYSLDHPIFLVQKKGFLGWITAKNIAEIDIRFESLSQAKVFLGICLGLENNLDKVVYEN